MKAASLLVVVPQIEELQSLLGGYSARGFTTDITSVGRVECTRLDCLRTLLAVGGHGKTQLALQTQYLVDHCPRLNTVLCVGGAGGLSGEAKFGDVVVGTCTIEHDYKLRFVERPLPCHPADEAHVETFRRVVDTHRFQFKVHFGPIASGDEDIVDTERAQEVRDETGALCVAWEGSGAARAAAFNGLRFIELRAITDHADTDSAGDYHANLTYAMHNIAELLVRWTESTNGSQ
jgi:adenosylhomocysteine nucleosidase